MALVDRALNSVESHARRFGSSWASERTMRREMGERGHRPGERSIGRVLRREERRAGTRLRGRIVEAGGKLPNGWRSTRRRKIYWFETRDKLRRQKRAAKTAARKEHERAAYEAHQARKATDAAAYRRARQSERGAALVELAHGEMGASLVDVVGRTGPRVRMPGPTVEPSSPVAKGDAMTPEEHGRMRELIDAGDFVGLAQFTKQRERPPPE